MIPKLKSHEGSWVAISLSTGEVVLELFRGDRRIYHINFDKFKLVPVGEYLASLND